MNEARRPMKLRLDDYIETPKTAAEAEKQQRENAMAFAVAEELLRYYPGHPWHVKVDLWTMDRGEKKPGAVMISLPVIMPEGKAYTIPLGLLRDHRSFVERIKHAGGEILERYQLPRSGMNFDRFLALRPKRRLTYRDQVPA